MSSDNIAIRVRNPGKKYKIGGPQEKYLTLRDAIVNSVKAPFKRFHPAPPSEEFLSAQRMCRLMWSRAMLWGLSGGMVPGSRHYLQLNIAVIDSIVQKAVYTPSCFFPSRRFMIVRPGTFLKSLTLSVKIPSSPRSRQCCAMNASFIRIFDA